MSSAVKREERERERYRGVCVVFFVEGWGWRVWRDDERAYYVETESVGATQRRVWMSLVYDGPLE
jgi:hypothetical protein